MLLYSLDIHTFYLLIFFFFSVVAAVCLCFRLSKNTSPSPLSFSLDSISFLPLCKIHFQKEHFMRGFGLIWAKQTVMDVEASVLPFKKSIALSPLCVPLFLPRFSQLSIAATGTGKRQCQLCAHFFLSSGRMCKDTRDVRFGCACLCLAVWYSLSRCSRLYFFHLLSSTTSHALNETRNHGRTTGRRTLLPKARVGRRRAHPSG